MKQNLLKCHSILPEINFVLFICWKSQVLSTVWSCVVLVLQAKSEKSTNPMEEDKEEQIKQLQNQNQNPKPNSSNYKETNQGKLLKGKSCKGCLYYSSALKSNSHNPICVGIPRTLNEGRSSIGFVFFVFYFDCLDSVCLLAYESWKKKKRTLEVLWSELMIIQT